MSLVPRSPEEVFQRLLAADLIRSVGADVFVLTGRGAALRDQHKEQGQKAAQ